MSLFSRFFISLAILLFVTGCASDEKIEEGFWYGKQNTEDFNYSLLFQVKNGKVIHYFKAYNDTLTIEKHWNRSLLKGFGDYKDYYFRSNDGSLRFYSSDKPLAYLTKADDNLFLFDILEDKSIQVELPEGVGDKTLFGVDYNLYSAVYIFKDQGQLKVSLCDTILPLKEELLFKEIVMNRRLAFIQKKYVLPRISLIVDKDVSIKDLNVSMRCFRAAGYIGVDILLKNIDYEYAKYLRMDLPDLTKEDRSKFFQLKRSIYLKSNLIVDFDERRFSDPRNINSVIMARPGSTPIDWIAKQDLFVVECDRGKLKLNGEKISDAKLQSEFKRRLRSDFRVYIHYYITPDSKIEDLVKLKSLLLSVRNEVYSKYLQTGFNINYDELKREDRGDKLLRRLYSITNHYVDASDYKLLIDRLTNIDDY